VQFLTQCITEEQWHIQNFWNVCQHSPFTTHWSLSIDDLRMWSYQFLIKGGVWEGTMEKHCRMIHTSRETINDMPLHMQCYHLLFYFLFKVVTGPCGSHNAKCPQPVLASCTFTTQQLNSQQLGQPPALFYRFPLNVSMKNQGPDLLNILRFIIDDSDLKRAKTSFSNIISLANLRTLS